MVANTNHTTTVADPNQGQVAANPRSFSGTTFLWFVATLLAFPFAGIAARVVLRPVDPTWTAVSAGAIAGALKGTAQWLVLRRNGADARWIAATAAGLAVGLGAAFAVFGYGTPVGDMAVVGAVIGLGIGIAQWWILRDLVGDSIVWIPASAAVWALGWTVSTAIGVDPDDRWAVPGLSGAAMVTLLSAALLWFLARDGRRDQTAA